MLVLEAEDDTLCPQRVDHRPCVVTITESAYYALPPGDTEAYCDLCGRTLWLTAPVIWRIRVLSDEEYAASEPQWHRDTVARVLRKAS